LSVKYYVALTSLHTSIIYSFLPDEFPLSFSSFFSFFNLFQFLYITNEFILSVDDGALMITFVIALGF